MGHLYSCVPAARQTRSQHLTKQSRVYSGLSRLYKLKVFRSYFAENMRGFNHSLDLRSVSFLVVWDILTHRSITETNPVVTCYVGIIWRVILIPSEQVSRSDKQTTFSKYSPERRLMCSYLFRIRVLRRRGKTVKMHCYLRKSMVSREPFGKPTKNNLKIPTQTNIPDVGGTKLITGFAFSLKLPSTPAFFKLH